MTRSTHESLREQLENLGVAVKLLTVGEDEFVILECPDVLAPEDAEGIRDSWRAASGPNCFLISGIKIAAVRYEDVETTLPGVAT